MTTICPTISPFGIDCNTHTPLVINAPPMFLSPFHIIGKGYISLGRIPMFVENTKTIERGGESVVTVLKQYISIQTIFKLFQVTINIIQHINNMSNEHQSHIRYTQRHIFMRKPIKGENLFFFE
jgi:hypothetical protein